MLMMIRARRVVLCLLATLSLARRLRLNVGLFFLSFDGLLGKHKQPPYTQWAKNMEYGPLCMYLNNFRKCLALLNSLLGAPINIQAIFLLKSRYFTR